MPRLRTTRTVVTSHRGNFPRYHVQASSSPPLRPKTGIDLPFCSMSSLLVGPRNHSAPSSPIRNCGPAGYPIPGHSLRCVPFITSLFNGKPFPLWSPAWFLGFDFSLYQKHKKGAFTRPSCACPVSFPSPSVLSPLPRLSSPRSRFWSVRYANIECTAACTDRLIDIRGYDLPDEVDSLLRDSTTQRRLRKNSRSQRTQTTELPVRKYTRGHEDC